MRNTPANGRSNVRSGKSAYESTAAGLLLDVARDGAERHVAVDRRFLRQAEHALADDVALDLVGTARDRHRRYGHEHFGDDAVVRTLWSGQHAARPDDVRVSDGRSTREVAR